MSKRTKIVCTIGPASESKATLAKMIRAGMDVARLNFSHGKYSNHRLLINNIRLASQQANRPMAIMQDLQGPRIRIGEVHHDGIDLRRGETVVFVPEQLVNYKLLITGQQKIVPLGYDQLYRFVKVGRHILINDGLIDVKVSRIKDRCIYGEVIKSGMVFSHKGINLPGVTIQADVITKKDKQDLIFGLRQGIDYVALSFVKDASNVRLLRKLIGRHPAKIIAKIERKEALDNFTEILAAADGIMVARGDLGIEIRPATVPLVQKEMIQQCLRAGKPVIVATQMLESMVINARPTRAEVSDVANAVIDHTDAVMLSGETAFGKYPVEAVQMMADIVKQTERSKYDDVPLHYLKLAHQTIPDSISFVADDLAHQEQVKAIVVNSLSGQAARLIARHRPELPLIVLTNNRATLRQLALIWGAQGYFVPPCKTLDELLLKSVQLVKQRRLVQPNNKIVVVTGHPVGRSQGINLVKLHTVLGRKQK
ncbi:MAG: pyruvate kinase [Candidatus Kerfeldbacteria bacterium]|nr:pyruvate kinase [Candidatus Kerfeldbacteria bacterium]